MLSQVARDLGGDHVGEDVPLDDATHDSRSAGPGSLFCAIVGTSHDGHDHVVEAVDNGAVAALVQHQVAVDVPQLVVADARRAAGPAAAVVHGHPSRELDVVGVTGTNGKTTVTWMLEGAFGAAARGTGVIGTIGARVHGAGLPGVRTTPEGPDFQRLLRTMRDRGVDNVAVEVSSHALDLHRVDGTRFRVAVFTNLSQDHLDHHGDMETYYRAKRALFTPAFSGHAVVWADDRWGQRLAEETEVECTTVGTDTTCSVTVRPTRIELDGGEAELVLDGDVVLVNTPRPGRHNLVNAVVSVVAAVRAGIPVDAAVAGVAAAAMPPGRLERVDLGQPFSIFVDYAHTPDALEIVVGELKRLVGGSARLHVVIGAGGDRDPTKRGAMGAAAAAADHAVLTSDNPRSEDPRKILDAVSEGAHAAVAGGARARIEAFIDRREAIAAALMSAEPGDAVLIAGKGHERVQELADGVIDFDDRAVAAEELRRLEMVTS